MSGTRGELEDERSYVERSIADLEQEFAAGDLAEDRYAELRARYEQRLAEVVAALVQLPSDAAQTRQPGPPPRRKSRLASRRARLITGWGGFSCLVVAAVLLAMAIAKVGPFAGSPQLTRYDKIQIELAEASVLGSKGEVTQALATYDRVLALDPTQPEALANGGWLARLAGISQHSPKLLRNGDAEIEAAVRVAPGMAQARAYDAVMLLQDRSQAARSAAQFRQMLKDHPSAALLRSVDSEAVMAFKDAKERLPAAFR